MYLITRQVFSHSTKGGIILPNSLKKPTSHQLLQASPMYCSQGALIGGKKSLFLAQGWFDSNGILSLSFFVDYDMIEEV